MSSRPKGTFDLHPNAKEDWKQVELWREVEETLRSLCDLYGYRELRTPIFEATSLFQRSVGEESDIVAKEMYTFTDKGNRSMTLRPEGTASALRAYIDNNLDQSPSCQKLFYIGPFFRYDRPQGGRFRQFHQFGIEAIGNASVHQDAETLHFLMTLFEQLQVPVKLLINSIGQPESRKQYETALQNYLKSHFSSLSPDSQRRFTQNPLRILDSKDRGDQALLRGAPSIEQYLAKEDTDRFSTLCSLLDALKISYTIDPTLVRGLDYYNHTVFEVVSANETSSSEADLNVGQKSLGGGGHYDGLLKALGGRDLSAIGFAIGIERVIQARLSAHPQAPKNSSRQSPFVYVIPLGEAERDSALFYTSILRKASIPSDLYIRGKKVGKALQMANDLGAIYSLLIGEDELSKQSAKLKHMESGEETLIPLASLVKTLTEKYTSEATK